MIPLQLENNSNINVTQVGLNEEIQSDHEQGLSEILTSEETLNNHKTISHGAKKLKLNNKLSDIDVVLWNILKQKRKI